VSRIPRSAATIIPYDVESRVQVLQERQAAKAAAGALNTADQHVTSGETKVAASHSSAAEPGTTEPPGAATPAPESAGTVRGLLRKREPGATNGERSATADQAGDSSSAAPDVTPIGSLHQPGRATVEGPIRVVEIRPVERNSVLACEISDSTGELTALFYGRSHIPGIVCGARVRFKGSVGIKGSGHPVMINPAYELLFPAVNRAGNARPFGSFIRFPPRACLRR